MITLQDNPLLFDSNIEERVNDFVNAAATQVKLLSLFCFLFSYISSLFIPLVNVEG